ncbi:hypothetical protein ACSBR2_029355 [Camellia fascicularis]
MWILTLRKNHMTKNAPKKSGRCEYYNEGDLQVSKERCLKRDSEMKKMGKKLADLQSVVHFMMSNNVMQPPYPLLDTPVLAAKKDAQKEGQKAIQVVPQHSREKECSHRPSRDADRTKLVRGQSQKTARTKGTYVREPRHIQGNELCFDEVDKRKSKRTNNDTESSTPKRLKSIDSRAPGREKEDLRNYLQRKRHNAEITSVVKSRIPFSAELDTFKVPKRFQILRFQFYDGKTNPNFHVGLYLNSMAL